MDVHPPQNGAMGYAPWPNRTRRVSAGQLALAAVGEALAAQRGAQWGQRPRWPALQLRRAVGQHQPRAQNERPARMGQDSR